MLPYRALTKNAGGVIPLAERCEVKVRDVRRWLAADGWVLVGTGGYWGVRGSHQQFKQPVKFGPVTVAGSGNDDFAPGTLNSILKQAGLKTSGQE